MISMNRDEFYSSLYLAHHGIKGQKWGVRRYQNEDGSYTDEGAKRRRSDNKPGMSDGAKKALKIGAVAAGTALAAIGAYKLYQMTKPVTAFTAFDMKKDFARIGVREIPGKLKNVAGKAGKELKKTTVSSLKSAGKAAASAALGAIGTITATQVAAQFKDKPGDDAQTRNANYIKREASTAAIKGAAGSAANRIRNNNGNNNGGSMNSSSYADIVSKVGEPYSKNPWGRQDVENRYVSFLNSHVDQKKDIKDMRKRKFDIEQIEKYYGK